MARHPVTIKIDEAIDRLENHDVEVTPESVEKNIDLAWNDWSPTEASQEALKRRILQQLRVRGCVIADAETRVRKDYWTCTPEELEEQIRVKQDSSDYDRNRINADKAVVAFLKDKRDSFGYDVYPGLFHSEIDRIYAMHSCASPGGAG